MSVPGKAMNIAAWVASALLFVLFTVLASPPKLMGDPQAVEGFIKQGYSDRFRLFIGAAEFVGGIALLIPRLAFWSAVGLCLIMAGAVYTHLANDDAANVAPAIVALLLAAFIAWARRGQALFLS
jgi:putative oxidoreductase